MKKIVIGLFLVTVMFVFTACQSNQERHSQPTVLQMIRDEWGDTHAQVIRNLELRSLGNGSFHGTIVVTHQGTPWVFNVTISPHGNNQNWYQVNESHMYIGRR